MNRNDLFSYCYIDHLELGLEPEPAHVVIKPPKRLIIALGQTNFTGQCRWAKS